VLAKAAELVEEAVRSDAEALRGRFMQERGRGSGGLAAEGADATLAALARSQVEVLLIVDDPDDERGAWFGAAPQQVATDRAAVEAMGEFIPVQGRLPDVAVRAALGTSAAVHVVDPASGTGLREASAPCCASRRPRRARRPGRRRERGRSGRRGQGSG
jgi:hypothetical protein